MTRSETRAGARARNTRTRITDTTVNVKVQRWESLEKMKKYSERRRASFSTPEPTDRSLGIKHQAEQRGNEKQGKDGGDS
jgi:hypothetical protein